VSIHIKQVGDPAGQVLLPLHRLVERAVLGTVDQHRVHVAGLAGGRVDPLRGPVLQVQEAQADVDPGIVAALDEAFGLAG
jgi:hypothetical protein